MIKSKSCVTRVFDALPKHAFRRKCGICVSNLLRFDANQKKEIPFFLQRCYTGFNRKLLIFYKFLFSFLIIFKFSCYPIQLRETKSLLRIKISKEGNEMNENKAASFEKRWQALTITNRYIFYRVMRDNQDICLKLLQLILPELGIKKIEFLEEEKQIEETPESRGVRLDAFAGEGERVFNIEMQARNQGNLAKRSRYNQAMVDEELLDKGADFESLKESYVIFISPFDKFGRKLIRYTFRNRCDEDKELELMDGAVKVFINAAGIREGADPDFAAFLDLMLGKKTSNRFADRVQEAVDIVKLDKEGRHRYMTVEMWIREEAKIAATEAAEKAAKEAHEEDAEIIAALTSENDSLVSENEKLRAELAKYNNPDEK